MRSFRQKPSNRRAIYLHLAGSIESQLREAYAKRHDCGLDTQASIAERLGIDRSAVKRRLTGRTNMTIETLADMAWALGHCVAVTIFDPDESPTNESQVRSEHASGPVAISASASGTPATIRSFRQTDPNLVHA